MLNCIHSNHSDSWEEISVNIFSLPSHLPPHMLVFYLQTVTAEPALSPSLQLSPRLSWTQVRARNSIEPALSLRLASASSERLGWYSFRVRQYLQWSPGQGAGGGGTVEQSLLSMVLHWLQSSPDTIIDTIIETVLVAWWIIYYQHQDYSGSTINNHPLPRMHYLLYLVY